MKCKCCKCYQELEEKEQVKEEHAIWCQSCHYKKRLIEWGIIGVVILFALLFFLYLIKESKDDE